MTLHPQVRSFLDTVAAENRPPWEDMPPDKSRELFASFGGVFGTGPELHAVADRTIAENVPVRVYRPAVEPNLPAVVYFHGGGWVLGNLDTHDTLCRKIANDASCVVIAVDYRLAPDAKFPAAFDDSFNATAYVADNAAEFGIDPRRIVVAGDSAGGNLAAAVAIRAAEVGSPMIRSQVLIYPVVEPNFDTKSYLDHADGFGLTRKTMMWFWEQYIDHDKDSSNPYAVPSEASNFAQLPPAHFVLAEHDVLLSEGKSYAASLQAAGVPTTMRHYEGMIHGFIHFCGIFDVGKQAVADLADHLKQVFA